MNNAEFQLRGVGDPRLAVHATSALPVWLWSTDGTRILWANPVGARLFGAANGAVLAGRIFGPADQHRRQVAQLAGRLSSTGAIRLERLRGFGAPLGALMTCGCARLEFADGNHGILITAAASAGRAMPLVERLQLLVEGIDSPIAAFARDGMFVGASDAARPLLGFRNLSEAGLDGARSDALAQGRVETPVGIGHMVLQRVGTGADVGLVALMAPAPAPLAPEHVATPDDERPAMPDAAPAGFALIDEFAASPPPETVAAPVAALPPEPVHQVAPLAELPAPDYEQPAMSGEAPAEFALIDEFAEPAEEPAQEPAAESVDEESSEEGDEDIDLQSVLQLNLPPVEASPIEAPLQPAKPDPGVEQPSHHAEAVAEEPALPPAEEVASAMEAPASPTNESDPIDTPPWLDAPPREHPLRFMWQMDADGRFSLGSEEFTRLIGAHTAAGFGRPWSDIAAALSGSIPTAASPGRSRPAAPGAISPWTGRSMAAAVCRSSWRDCRSTITPESLRAIGVSGFAAISTH